MQGETASGGQAQTLGAAGHNGAGIAEEGEYRVWRVHRLIPQSGLFAQASLARQALQIARQRERVAGVFRQRPGAGVVVEHVDHVGEAHGDTGASVQHHLQVALDARPALT